MSSQSGDAPSDEKQCRICLDGPDPVLGRLIRPCLCRGSISYVHVKCLQRWRNSSTSKSAFYACPQCHYRYAFARTRALGIASNPLFVGILATFFFTCIVLCASFVATYLVVVDADEDPFVARTSYYRSIFLSPSDVAKDLMRMVFRILRDQNVIQDDSLFRRSASGIRPSQAPRPPSSLLGRVFARFILGLPVVGVASFVQLVWSTSMLGPLSFFTRRGARQVNVNRRERSRDIATFLLLIAVAGGAIRALWSVYRLTEKWAKRLLLRAEDVILEVN